MPELHARYLTPEGAQVSGRLIGDEVQDLSPPGPRRPLASVRLLAPCQPSKVVAVASNYLDHAREMGRELPKVPKIFLKPSTAVIGPDDPITLPPGTTRVDHEAELAVVIGARCSRVRPDEAMAHVLGITALNDVTARDFQKADGAFGRAKGFDSFCPIGPVIAVGLDPSDLAVRARVDGELRQDGRSADMIFDVPTLISFISGVMTLLPGDVIATGTPAGVGPLAPGQLVEIEVEGVGTLRNPVVLREDAAPGSGA